MDQQDITKEAMSDSQTAQSSTWPTPESTGSSDSKPQPPLYTSKQEIIENLERMSASCIHAFNDRDFTYSAHQDRIDLVASVSLKFGCYVENYPSKPLTWPELLQLFRDFASVEPHCYLKILEISTDVFANGTAIVYVEVTAHGVQNIMTARFMEMKWKIQEGRWIYYSCTTMGGSPFHTGLPV